MMNQGFWGLAALTLVLLAHSVYLWYTTTKGKKLQPLAKGKKLVVGMLLCLCGGALVAGIVLMLLAVEEAAVHVAGLVMLLAGFGLNDRVRRYLPDMIRKEEEIKP